MKPIVDKDKLTNLTNEIWKSAERLRGKFKAYEYQAGLSTQVHHYFEKALIIDANGQGFFCL